MFNKNIYKPTLNNFDINVNSICKIETDFNSDLALRDVDSINTEMLAGYIVC